MAAVGGAGLAATGCRTAFTPPVLSPNSRLNIGVIGVAGQGKFSLDNLTRENIVALCDVDDNNLAAAKQRFPQAQTYNDFRRMLDRNDLDAVVVATPDHTHAVCAAAALRSGRHLYCEKPLAKTISETRIITELARKHRRVTQIGTQIHAGSNYRRVVELVQSGAIGPVREVHVWASAVYGNKPAPKPADVPAHLHYDLWLGPVEPQPYSPDFVPFHWRNWWAFGGGSLADFGCHFMDLPYWALDLEHPLSAEPISGPPVNAAAPPPWLVVEYQFPRRGSKPPVALTWYHGGKYPERIGPDLYNQWKSGVLFVGTRGRQLIADYGRHKLLPERDFEGFVRPTPFLLDSIGHHNEWTQAIRNGTNTTTCRFDYSGPLTEAALLGNVAYRIQKKIEWNSRRMRADNAREAEAFIHHHYRAGWSI